MGAGVSVLGLDHVQLAIPPGGEAKARPFYAGVLGLPELAKPAALASRGGAWFQAGAVQLHLGVEADFRPARKAHPALVVADLAAVLARARAAGAEVREDDPDPDPRRRRAFVFDPFGNRLELVERR
jgi:catechol 2,3-dioxygenase-like lactoylglutathione lyase family enzyme